MTQTVSPRKIVLRIYTHYEERKVFARVTVVGETHIVRGGRIELEMYAQRSGTVYHRRTLRNLPAGARKELTFSMKGIPSGCAAFRAVFHDRHGTPFTTEVMQDTSPGDVPWLGSDKGVTRKVPAPWTALKTRGGRDGCRVECWGREYDFDPLHFIKRVLTREKSVLAGPMQLVARVNGRDVRWRDGKLRLVTKGADLTIMEHRMRAGALRFASRTEVEFDGMVRVDWALTSEKPVRLDGLALEVPIHERYAKYLYHFPGKWGSALNASALPARGVTAEFWPFIWLGDEERGLAWFTESEENLFHRQPDKVTRTTRKGKTVTLRINLVSTPLNLVPEGRGGSQFTGWGDVADLPSASAPVASKLRYTFGLQATPVKPVKDDAWDHRIVCIGQNAPGFRPRLNIPNRLLDELAGAGVRAVVIFEHWADAESHVRTPHGRKLKKIVKACHDRGLQVLLYFGFLISDIAPEWRDFGKDSMVMPRGGYPVFHYLPQPEQSAWRVCLQSPWQDLLATGMAETLAEFDADGVYLDGTEYPFGCCNTEHGCGTLRADGSIAPSYPIFAVRSAMRRIYHAVRSRRPNGHVNIHNSTCMTIPTLGWGTSYWDGEQFQSIGRGVDVRQLLPLDTFRAEFMGRQWGVPAEFLLAGSAYTYEQACSFSLLHDVPVRPRATEAMTGAASSTEIMSVLWKTVDAFDRKRAEWLPYWRNGDLVSVSPKGAYASLYRHPKNGVLAVVSNLSGKRMKVTLKLNLKRLGLKGGPLTARDALKERTLAMRDGTLSLSLPHLGWKLLWIRYSAM